MLRRVESPGLELALQRRPADGGPGGEQRERRRAERRVVEIGGLLGRRVIPADLGGRRAHEHLGSLAAERAIRAELQGERDEERERDRQRASEDAGRHARVFSTMRARVIREDFWSSGNAAKRNG